MVKFEYTSNHISLVFQNYELIYDWFQKLKFIQDLFPPTNLTPDFLVSISDSKIVGRIIYL